MCDKNVSFWEGSPSHLWLLRGTVRGGAVVRLSQRWLTVHQDAGRSQGWGASCGLGALGLWGHLMIPAACPLGNGVPSWSSASL